MADIEHPDMSSARRDDASRFLAAASTGLICMAIVMFILAATGGDLTLFEIARTLLGCGLTGLLLWLAVLSIKR